MAIEKTPATKVAPAISPGAFGPRVPLLGTHAPKLNSPYSESAVPLAMDLEEVPNVIGSHSIPPADRLIGVANGAMIPSARESMEAIKAGGSSRWNPSAAAILSACSLKQPVYSEGCDQIDAFLPQIIFDGPDGEEILLTPLTAPRVLDGLFDAIETLGAREVNPLRPEVSRHMAYVGKPMNLASLVRLRGPIPHAVPPVVERSYVEKCLATHNPQGWVNKVRFEMRNRAWFVASWDGLVAHIKEAGATSERLPGWAKRRGDTYRRTLVSHFEYRLKDCAEDETEFKLLRATAISGFADAVAQEAGALPAHTISWLKGSL